MIVGKSVSSTSFDSEMEKVVKMERRFTDRFGDLENKNLNPEQRARQTE